MMKHIGIAITILCVLVNGALAVLNLMWGNVAFALINATLCACSAVLALAWMTVR